MNAYTYKSPRFLAKLVTASFFIYVVGMVWMLYGYVKGIGYMNTLDSGVEVEQHLLDAWDATYGGFELKLLGWQLVGAVIFCFWTYRVVANAHAFGAPGESPGMAVGSYFIPFINLWRPYKAITETWIASDPAAIPGAHGDAWAQRGASAPGYFLAWWLTWTLSNLASYAALRADTDTPTPSELASNFRVLIGVNVIELVALGLMFAVVWSLTRRQEQRNASGIATATVFT